MASSSAPGAAGQHLGERHRRRHVAAGGGVLRVVQCGEAAGGGVGGRRRDARRAHRRRVGAGPDVGAPSPGAQRPDGQHAGAGRRHGLDAADDGERGHRRDGVEEASERAVAGGHQVGAIGHHHDVAGPRVGEAGERVVELAGAVGREHPQRSPDARMGKPLGPGPGRRVVGDDDEAPVGRPAPRRQLHDQRPSDRAGVLAGDGDRRAGTEVGRHRHVVVVGGSRQRQLAFRGQRLRRHAEVEDALAPSDRDGERVAVPGSPAPHAATDTGAAARFGAGCPEPRAPRGRHRSSAWSRARTPPAPGGDPRAR